MMSEQTPEHLTAGCLLLRKSALGKMELLLIFQHWRTGDEGYVPPKGHVEGNEPFPVTAVRETREETGYTDFRILDYLGETDFFFEHRDGRRHHKVTHWFLAILNSDTRVEPEQGGEYEDIREIKWFALEESKQRLRFDADRPLIDKIYTYLETHDVTVGDD